MAVSGGQDSIALFDALLRLRKRLKLTIEVAHVNHGLRESSADDAAFVARLALAHSVPLHLCSLSPNKMPRGTEAWAREERYRFFKAVLDERRLDWIITAHQANDVAETLLMRLVANKEPNSILRVDKERKLLRPLLDITRKEIEAYVKEHDLEFIIDESNDDLKFTRNKVRQKIIPMLEAEFGPSLIHSLAARAEALATDEDFLQGLAKGHAAKLAPFKWGSREWLLECKNILTDLPEPICWRLVEELCKPVVGFTLGEGKAKEVKRMLLGNSSEVNLTNSFGLKMCGGRITRLHN